jgi:RNA polymerase sigma-70 factor, ECF subfamily
MWPFCHPGSTVRRGRAPSGVGPALVSPILEEYSGTPLGSSTRASCATHVFGRRPATPFDGDQGPSTFEQEILALIDRLYSAALRLTRSEADAQDLVQDTYLRAFRAADQFRPGTSARAWMFTILHNTFLNARRDQGRSPIETDSDVVERAADLAGGAASPEDILLREVMDVDLKGALEALPAVFREAVWLRDVEQFSYDEMATILGVPIGTVMSRISRGRRLLHDQLVARTNRFGRRPKASGGARRPTRV